MTGSRFEQFLTHYQQARLYFPGRYRELARVRPPVLLKVNLKADFPRCYVTRRIFQDGGLYLGPFAKRKSAEEFADRFLDFFKVRRCQIRILRDPQFSGCIYSEMNMCLAPCFAGCTDEEYDHEIARLVESLASRGRALTDGLESEREASSEALDFERAATVQKRIEKVQSVLRALPELARNIEQLDAVILQKGAEVSSVAVFSVRAGMIGDPFFLNFGEQISQPRSAEETLRAGLESTESPTRRPSETKIGDSQGPAARQGDANVIETTGTANANRERLPAQARSPALGEHLALVARWFYSNPREGEILFRERSWPYRRILRACSRVLGDGESKPKTSAPQAKLDG